MHETHGGMEKGLGLSDTQDRDEQIYRVLCITARNVRLTARIVGCAPNTVYNVGREKGLLPR